MSDTAEISRKFGAELIPAAGVWKIDSIHSTLAFDCGHMTLTKLRGTFDSFSGEFHIAEVPEESAVEVTIESDSLQMASKMVVMAVKGPDFLNVESFPTFGFKSTTVRHVDKDLWKVTGDLTIRDITQQIVLDARLGGVVAIPPMMGSDAKLGFEVRGEFDRRDFGMELNMALPGGGWIVGNRVGLLLDVEADIVSLADA